MWPELLALLIASYGLDPKANDEQGVDHLKSLSAEQRTQLSEALGGDSETKIASLVAGKDKSDKTQLRMKIITDDGDAILAAEGRRVTQLQQLGKTLDVAEHVVKLSISRGDTVIDARKAYLKWLSDNAKPPTGGLGGDMTISEDQNVATLRDAIPQALVMRWGGDKVDPDKFDKFEAREKRDRQGRSRRALLGKVHERAHELKQMPLKEMLRVYLTSIGCDVLRSSDVQLSEMLGRRGLREAFPKVASLAESTSDFASITLDAINKAVRYFYLDAEKTWPIWCQRVTNPDFKTRYSIVLSESPNMKSRNEGGELKYLTLSDGKESYQVVEYVGGIKLTRRAIVNDDKGCFAAIPMLLSNAASRLEDDTAYGLLTNGTSTSAPYVMSDGHAVFDAANHANYTSSGTAISVNSLAVGKTAMKKQKGSGGAARLELEPKILLVPTSIEEQTYALMQSDIQIASASGNTTVAQIGNKNPFYKRYQVVGSTRLDDISTTSWYLAADPNNGKCSGAEMCFLEDEPEPVIRQETDFDTEDVKFLQRHTVAGKIVDYRSFYKNAGA